MRCARCGTVIRGLSIIGRLNGVRVFFCSVLCREGKPRKTFREDAVSKEPETGAEPEQPQETPKNAS